MNHGDLMNLCFSCLIDGTGEHAPITLEEAAYTLQCWQEEGNELAEETKDLTAQEFMDAWNHVFWLLHFQRQNKHVFSFPYAGEAETLAKSHLPQEEKCKVTTTPLILQKGSSSWERITVSPAALLERNAVKI